jgi:hypothetical protein
MKALLILSLLLGLGAACSKTPPTSAGPAPAADPKASSTVPAKSASPAPLTPITAASDPAATTAAPATAVFNQFDPPVPLPGSR